MLNTKTTVVTVATALSFVLLASLLKLDALQSLIAYGIQYDLLRIALLGGLVAVLVTSVPRSLLVRSVLGVGGAALHIAAVYMLMNYQIGLLDGLVYMAAAVICEVTALEVETSIAGQDFATVGNTENA